MKKLILFLMASMFFMSFANALVPYENIVYDSFSDGVVNQSLWVNSTGTSEFSNLLQLTATNGQTGLFIKSIDFIDATNLQKFLYNVSFAHASAISGSSWSTGTCTNRIFLFGTMVKEHTISCTAFNNLDSGTIYGQYNETSQNFDWYYNTVKMGQLAMNTNFINITADNGATTGIGTQYNRIQQVDYTLRKTLDSNLTSPTNNDYISTDTVTFETEITTPNITSLNFTLLNATLFVWDSSGSVYGTNFTTMTGTSNETSLTLTGFDPDSYTWNYYICQEGGCYFGSNNNTFTYSFMQNAITFDTPVIETSNQTFMLNITKSDSISLVSAILYYNNTAYSTTKTTEGDNRIFTTTLDVPAVPLSTNISFYWTLDLDGFQFNSTFNNQTVNTLNLGLCNGTITQQIFNFTSYLEKNTTRINPYSFAGTFDYYVGSGSTIKSTSTQNTSAAEVLVCVSSLAETIYLDAEIDYGFESDNLTTAARKYFFQDAPITENQNISLYLLENEEASTFILNVLDKNSQPVGDALIHIQRYYPSEGVYRTVQISKTDENGRTVGFYKTETVTYKHIITKDGVVLLDTGTGGIVVGESVPFTLNFIVGDTQIPTFELLDGNSTISTSLTYNDTTKIVLFTYIDPTGSTNYGRLEVYQDSLTNSTRTTICNNSVTGSSGSITCNMTGLTGTFVAKGYVTTETNLQKIITFLITTARDIFDETGAILGWFIILTVAMTALWNPSVGVILIDASIILVGATGLLVFSPLTYFSIVGISIILLIMFRT